MDNNKLIYLAQKGDKDALDRLVRDNSPLVLSVVNRFSGRGYEKEDLFQIGCMGFIKCIQKFDLSLNLKLSTYAVPMIMGEIKRFLRDNGSIKVSRSLKEIYLKAKTQEQIFIRKEGREPTLNELAQLVDCDLQNLMLAMESQREIQSIYQRVNNDESNSPYLLDKIAGKNSEDLFVDKIILKEMIDKLEDRDKKIIFLRYFKDKTQNEVAKIMGISQVQVSRIEKKILENFRKWYVG